MIHYFDNAATTRVDDDLIELIAKYNTEKYFNPSSLHRYALDVASDVHSARKDIADCLNCNVDELYFTSCGSESDNTAIFGAMPSNTSLNVVSTAVEHSAVYSSMMQLKNRGYDVRFCKVNQ